MEQHSEEQLVIRAIQKVLPAVVSIVITKHLSQVRAVGLFPFKQFWGQGKDAKERAEEPISIGGGSGVLVDADGLIVTNKHVVFDPEAEYAVVTMDEKEYAAKVVSRDPINDIAVLKIDVTGMPTAPMGNSAKIQLGQTVIAIGTALGLFTNSVSKGIISGLSRRITASLGVGDEVEELRNVIQTDVAINQGNSGGPLINLDGEVIGINTAVIMGAQNIGFAIPIDWARKDLEDIRRYGRVIKPYLGLRYVMLTSKLKERYKLAVERGALVVRDHISNAQAVIPGSPADKAGIQENDIIISIAGKSLQEKKVELVDVVQEFKVGDVLDVVCLRDGKEVRTTLTLEERK